MRELVRDKGRLEDIVEYSSNVLKIIDGIEFEEFSSNILVYFATMKNVEIVGEAAYMLTKEFKATHPEIPWKQVEGMRAWLSRHRELRLRFALLYNIPDEQG